MPVLQIVVASTRPGKVGLPVADRFRERVQEHGRFTIDWACLAEINLPFMDEPKHLRFHDYTGRQLDELARLEDALRPPRKRLYE